jgi:hypothetical protein
MYISCAIIFDPVLMLCCWPYCGVLCLFRSDFETTIFYLFLTSHLRAACISPRLNHPDTLAQYCTSRTRKYTNISPITTFKLILSLCDRYYAAFVSNFCESCPYKMALPLMLFANTLTITMYITRISMCSTLAMYMYIIMRTFKEIPCYDVKHLHSMAKHIQNSIQNIWWFIRHSIYITLLIRITVRSQTYKSNKVLEIADSNKHLNCEKYPRTAAGKAFYILDLVLISKLLT